MIANEVTVSNSVRGTVLILLCVRGDGDPNDPTARPSLRGCVSKPSVTMVSAVCCTNCGLLQVSANRRGNRDGYIHEGQQFLPVTDLTIC